MQTNLSTLFEDLMHLCETNEAFYYVDQFFAGSMHRIFTYRLASYTDFQNRNAIECRGHTFVKTEDGWQLASLPMQKFFNYGEHVGWGTDLDLSQINMVMDKLDGSLISTVSPHPGSWYLKSKTSFNSAQAVAATELLRKQSQNEYHDFNAAISKAVRDGYTVNFEYVAPDNTIVIVYAEPKLVVLNARHMTTGEYMSHQEMVVRFGGENVVACHEIPSNPEAYIQEISQTTGIEGVIICFNNGLWVKLKTDAYCVLHKTKDVINNPRALWEACVLEGADDLRALFCNDALAVQRIIDMEERAAKHYNQIYRSITAFYEANKGLDRKSYAILGQEQLSASGTFSLAMNAYLGKEVDIKSFMIKNYKMFGITEETNVNDET